MIKTIETDIIKYGDYSVKISLDIPLNDISSIDAEQEEQVSQMLITQLTRGLEKAREKYRRSELPNHFIEQQNYVITNNLPINIYGAYNGATDEIVFDADTISDIRGVEAAFVHGHEIGHKIIRYKRMENCLEEIARILGVSKSGYKHLLKELLCDECGNMVANTSRDRLLFNHPIEEEKRNYIQRKILYNIYR